MASMMTREKASFLFMSLPIGIFPMVARSAGVYDGSITWRFLSCRRQVWREGCAGAMQYPLNSHGSVVHADENHMVHQGYTAASRNRATTDKRRPNHDFGLALQPDSSFFKSFQPDDIKYNFGLAYVLERVLRARLLNLDFAGFPFHLFSLPIGVCPQQCPALQCPYGSGDRG